MEELKLKNDTDKYYTYEGTVVYNGHMVNVFLDDYGQSYFIQYEDNGELVEECCGSYCGWKGFVEYRFRDKGV